MSIEAMNTRDNILRILTRNGQYTPEQLDRLYDLLDRLSDLAIDVVLKQEHVDFMSNASEEATEVPPTESRVHPDQSPMPVPMKRRGGRIIISTEQS